MFATVVNVSSTKQTLEIMMWGRRGRIDTIQPWLKEAMHYTRVQGMSERGTFGYEARFRRSMGVVGPCQLGLLDDK
jgi:hypothetical protein